ncbi:MAG: hypothetical protein IPO13_02635 [Rhodocyclaceae bacterium]|nr:hypothetical protein [Rhodocyclaceae bacterium]
MFDFFKHLQYRQKVHVSLCALLMFYPKPFKELKQDYPGIKDVIRGYFKDGTGPETAAVSIAGFILTDILGKLDVDSRERVRDQLSGLDIPQFRAAVVNSHESLNELMTGTRMVGLAFALADSFRQSKAIDQFEFDHFVSEILGTLQGKSKEQRTSERTVGILHEAFGISVILDGDDDASEVLPLQLSAIGRPDFSGIRVNVRLEDTPTGIAMLRVEDGQPITDRRNLKQEDLARVPRDAEKCEFVNLNSRTGDNYSCIIAGDDSEVFGDGRAFWWALAEVKVVLADSKVNGQRMTANALARMHFEARTMWDIAVEQSGSIGNMRDALVLMRNAHVEVINKLSNDANTEAAKLGFEIVQAMILATESEDEKLEEFAFHRFRRFLWKIGEEPTEFHVYCHD